MKNLLLVSISILLLSCSQEDRKSEREKQIDATKEIVMKFFNAQSEGDIETMKSLVSEDFQYTLNGQLDISNTYYGWDEFLKFMGEFGTLLKGSVGVEFLEIIPSENTAIIFAEGRMEGIAGKYENEYALKYSLNKDGQVTAIKEYLSDLLLAQKLYSQDLCGKKMAYKNENLNMLLLANVSDVDAFKKYSYDINQPKFKNWSDASKSVFAKVNDTTVIELFFDIDKEQLQEFLNDPEVSENISRFNFKPIRYSFETYIDWPTSSVVK